MQRWQGTEYLAKNHYMANETTPLGHVVPETLTTTSAISYAEAHPHKTHYLANFAQGTYLKTAPGWVAW